MKQVLRWVLAAAKKSGDAARGGRVARKPSGAAVKRGAKGGAKKAVCAEQREADIRFREGQPELNISGKLTNTALRGDCEGCDARGKDAKLEQSEGREFKPVRNLGKCLRDGLRKRFSKIVDNVLQQAESDLSAAKVVFGFEVVKDEMKPLRKGRRACGPSLAQLLQDELAKKAAERVVVRAGAVGAQKQGRSGDEEPGS